MSDELGIAFPRTVKGANDLLSKKVEGELRMWSKISYLRIGKNARRLFCEERSVKGRSRAKIWSLGTVKGTRSLLPRKKEGQNAEPN
jgi:hypothetical protein